jgi:hypothetical protein
MCVYVCVCVCACVCVCVCVSEGDKHDTCTLASLGLSIHFSTTVLTSVSIISSTSGRSVSFACVYIQHVEDTSDIS